MVIECNNLDKLTAVLIKMEEETDYKWYEGDNPIANIVRMKPMSWPIWLVVDTESKTITWSEERIIGEEYMTDDEYLYRFTLSEVEDDPVNHPSHYTQGKVECIDAMEEALGTEVVKGFCLGNTYKYLWRHADKNGDEDIKKAVWYFSRYKQILNR